jgi:hypothetical protein
VSNKVHITGWDRIGSYLLRRAASAVAVYSVQIPCIIQTDPNQLFDFLSDLFDPQSQFSSSHTCLTSLCLSVHLIDPDA